MTASEAILEVRYGATRVGRIRDTDGRIAFAYARDWLDAADAFPISLSLPLREEPYAGGAGHAFFANLLPEGAVRQAVCRRLGISEDNDLALLRAIGGECAGALAIVEPSAPVPDPDDEAYEALDDRRLQRLVSDESLAPLLVGGPRARMSLAGAQDKLAVAVLDGRLHLAQAGAPSTHILKLPHRQLRDVPTNEAFVTGLARRIGLDVVDVELVPRTDPPSLLVRRYDRVETDDPWPARRLHQEDLCQALGLPPSRKYEQEGGPSLVSAIELVRRHVAQPLHDVRRLIEWQAFDVVAGNSDGHGKNLSLVYDGAAPRVAPFYDLLSTRHYPALDRQLAMGVGGRRDPDQLGRAQWERLATELEIRPELVVQLVGGVAERCAEALADWTREFHDRHGEAIVADTLRRAITRRARKLARSLASRAQAADSS